MHAKHPKNAEPQPAAASQHAIQPPQTAPLRIMPQLTVGAIDDPYEREADAMADRVMRKAQPFAIQRKCAHCEEEEKAQRTPFIQRQTTTNDTATQAPDSITQGIRSSAGKGAAMSQDTRSFMESRFGADFSGVRIHTGSEAAGLADSIQAKAFTVGNDIWFNSGAYEPGTAAGQHLLAHELTHTLQQGGAIRRQTKSTKCPDAVVEQLNKEMHEYYNKNRSCTDQGDTCVSATAKVAAGYGAVMGRVILQQKCFSPGDLDYEEHMKKISETFKTLRNCERIMMEKCGPPMLAAAAAALAAVGAKKGAGKALKRMAESMGGKVAGKALIYASAAAAVLLLMSGKAEAKISLEGDDPLVALFKAMEQDGEPVPEEFKALIASDPELKKALEDAARKGNMSEAQKAMAKSYTDFLRKHMDEFSEEELKALMSTTEQVSGQLPKDLKVEDLKQALKQKAAQKAGEGKGGAGGGGAASDSPQQVADAVKDITKGVPLPQPAADALKEAAKAEGSTPQQTPVKPETTPPATDAFKNLSEENRKKIQGAPAPVADLFKAFTSATEGDVKLSDEAVKQFFAVVPADLSKEESATLAGQLTSSTGKTLAQLIENLRKGVEAVRKTKDAPAGGETAGQPADPDKPAQTEADQIAALKEMAIKTDFSKLPMNQVVIRDFVSKVTGTRFSSYVFVNNNGKGMVAVISGEVAGGKDVTKLKKGEKFTIKITSLSKFVDKQGVTHNIKIDTTFTMSK
ncbi:DUF4157 domain-containing protein [Chitinophaga agrisoli]|uniref:DUF4157 domain-containing protein n=1 Tax=Chitinophaga agrisoli TaxID=2607653 RepID=A0A5B2VKG3_9BACT|nr:DUF4157 domain-containing protein [Chitinophaga agrisoli]KAA2238782.1 DUF4157 domain-containing protein [Chitinophaga agrisoli]